MTSKRPSISLSTMRSNTQRIWGRFVVMMRGLTSVLMFFLALTKAVQLSRTGLEPYVLLVSTMNIPVVFKFYVVIAICLELVLAIGVWVEKLFSISIIPVTIMSGMGVLLSLYSLHYKNIADCGCGLLGDNEVGLLIQKLMIIVLLLVLYYNKRTIFIADKA